MSKQQYNALTRAQVRKMVGEDPATGNFMCFFQEYFGDRYGEIIRHGDSYDLYVEWYKLEHSPLGKAMK